MARKTNFSVSPSKYFKNYEFKARQDLVDSLVRSAIRQTGMNIKYIPKENFIRDDLFGDDTFTKYEKAITLDCYVKSNQSFGGAGDIFTKMNFQIADTVLITISRTRWLQVQEEAFLPDIQSKNEVRDNPSAGDLIYFPLFDKIFEITHVEQESVFWQFGKNYVFDLNCELYKYNQDEFQTGFDPIDSISDLFSRDMTKNQLVSSDGAGMVSESGEPIITSDYDISTSDVTANNSTIENLANTDVIDYSKKSPFTGPKW